MGAPAVCILLREREREREREKERKTERERVVVATQPISLVVGFMYGLAPHIATGEREKERRERERKRERDKEREKRVYVRQVLPILTKNQGA